MKNVFVSYSRQSESAARSVAGDIEALGHTVWMDNELSGGQTWWNKILTTIRECDVLVFVVDPGSLKSTACQREYGYAATLGKVILPVLVSNEVRTNLLPPALSQIQFVDFRDQDKKTALSLGRALTQLPPSPPLPEPLPAPPEVPMSYLGSLSEQVEAVSLTEDEQLLLVAKLRNALRDSETVHDARTLLDTLRKRRDLLRTTADEIDDLLGNATDAPSEEPSPPKTKPVSEPSPVDTPSAAIAVTSTIDKKPQGPSRKMKWLKGSLGAVVGGVAGYIFAVFIHFSRIFGRLPEEIGVLFIILGGIAGAFIAMRSRKPKPAIAG